MAARFSAISSRSAALDLKESSAEETQESDFDDRRERARPVGDDKYANLPVINLLAAEKETMRVHSISMLKIDQI